MRIPLKMTHEHKDLKKTEYLGVLILPSKADLKSIARHLSGITELDAKNIENRLLGGVPAILGSMSPPEAKKAVEWMNAQGIESGITNDREIKEQGRPIVVKDIEVKEGQLRVRPMRDQEFSIAFSNVRTIVHGNLGLPKPHSKSDRASHIENKAWELPLATPITGHVISRQNLTSARAKSNASKSLRQIIDLHCHQDGHWTLLRIDGDKQGWRHLGKARGYSDLNNAKKTLELFEVILSDATCDESFREFVPPKESRFQIHKETPREIRQFDFYSRWISRMHVNLRGDSI